MNIHYFCQPGGMVDAIDSKSIISNGVRVQVPWLVPIKNNLLKFKSFIMPKIAKSLQ